MTIGSILIVVGTFVGMYFCVSNWKLYFSFGDNLLMSMLFIAMYYIRKGTKGQSLSIAVCKLIGTLSATITMILAGSLFGIVVGGLCFVLDAVYVYIICKHLQNVSVVSKEMIV